MVLADVNDDGKPDVVVTNDHTAGAGLTVLLNQGNGVFGSPKQTAVNGDLLGIKAADLNVDGKADVAVLAFGTGYEVRTLLSAGDGTFGTATTQPAGTTPTAFALLDANADNKPDLVIGNSGDMNVSVLLGSGTGTFASPIDIPAASFEQDVLAVDVTSDGKPDLVVSGGDQVWILVNKGGGQFSKGQVLSEPSAVSAIARDFTGDGKLDLAVFSSSSGALRVWAGDGTGTFTAAPQAFVASGTPIDASVGDVDGDGRVDIVVPSSEGAALLHNAGGGRFATGTAYTGPVAPVSSAIAADLNGDAKPDAVTLAYDGTISVFLNQGTGLLASPIVTAPAVAHQASEYLHYSDVLAAADVTGDGKTDLVAVEDDGTTRVLPGLGNGKFGTEKAYTWASGPQFGLVATDLDGDHDVDLAVTDYLASKILIALNQGNGMFGTPTALTLPFATLAMRAADLTGDGKPEIVVLVGSGDGVTVFKNLGSGSFGTPAKYADSTSPQFLQIADLDGDGKLDIVTASQQHVTVFTNAGDGTFGTPKYVTPAQTPAGLEIADLDADGKPDILAAGQSSTAYVYRNLGGGGFALVVPTSIGGTSPFVADFDGDRRVDVGYVSDTHVFLVPNTSPCTL
jgi:hypothetical protein